MKKILLFALAIILLQNYAFSQRVPRFIKGSSLLFGPTWSNWVEYAGPVKIKPERNIGFDVSTTHRFKLGTDIVGLQAGLGLSMVNIHSNVNPWQFIDSNGAVDPVGLGIEKRNYKRNKLALAYLELPIELVFKFNRSDSSSKTGFKFALGWRTGFCIDAKTKITYDDFIEKRKDFDNINRWRYGPTVRLGYGMFSVYARYDLSSTFDHSSAPNYNLYTFGLMVSRY